MPGKVSTETLLDHVFTRTGTADRSVLQGPALGEDAAAIAVEETTLVISSDPISLAASAIGELGVSVACNDVAAAGGEPHWLTVVLFLPSDDPSVVASITRDLDETARATGVSIVGGHTEVLEPLERPLAVLTAVGTTERFVPTSGARPGDTIVLTEAAGLEGTAILAGDFGADLDVPAATVEAGRSFLESISVLAEARCLRSLATAMHDPTEGGVAAGLVELALASGVHCSVDPERVPVRSETRALAEAAGVDPLRIFGSGALLATVPEESLPEARARLDDAAIEAAVIGEVDAEGAVGVTLGEEWLETPPRDDLYPLWAASD